MLNILANPINCAVEPTGTMRKIELAAEKIDVSRNIFRSVFISSSLPEIGKWAEVGSLQEMMETITKNNLSGFYKNATKGGKSKFFVSVPPKSWDIMSGKTGFKTEAGPLLVKVP